MRRMLRDVSCLVMFTLAGCSAIQEYRFVTNVKDKPAKEFELTALDGGTVRLSDYRGKPVLLAFWAVG